MGNDQVNKGKNGFKKTVKVDKWTMKQFNKITSGKGNKRIGEKFKGKQNIQRAKDKENNKVLQHNKITKYQDKSTMTQEHKRTEAQQISGIEMNIMIRENEQREYLNREQEEMKIRDRYQDNKKNKREE